MSWYTGNTIVLLAANDQSYLGVWHALRSYYGNYSLTWAYFGVVLRIQPPLKLMSHCYKSLKL